jgi:hypothetical protein
MFTHLTWSPFLIDREVRSIGPTLDKLPVSRSVNTKLLQQEHALVRYALFQEAADWRGSVFTFALLQA